MLNTFFQLHSTLVYMTSISLVFYVLWLEKTCQRMLKVCIKGVICTAKFVHHLKITAMKAFQIMSMNSKFIPNFWAVKSTPEEQPMLEKVNILHAHELFQASHPNICFLDRLQPATAYTLCWKSEAKVQVKRVYSSDAKRQEIMKNYHNGQMTTRVITKLAYQMLPANS